MFGREARLPIDIAFGTKSPVAAKTGEYASQLKQALTEAFDRVRDSQDTVHRHQSELYNKKVHGDPFNVGDLVWLHSTVIPTGQSRKLYHPWTGPFRITEKIGDADYRIKEVYGKKPPMVVHFNRLKHCKPGTRLPCVEPGESDDPSQELDTSDHRPPHMFELKLVDGEDPTPLRRSSRACRPPDRLMPVVIF